MKKILSILLSLALLVSLTALTTAPVSAATECVCPTLSPASGTFDYCNPCGVATTIIWNDASNVTAVRTCDGTSLTQNTDWFVFGCLLVISPTYLSTVLLDDGDCVCLDVIFDVCVVNFIITGVCKGSATIDPTKANWVFGSTSNVLATITTNCPGNTVVSVNNSDTKWLATPTDYVVADNLDGTLNLTINGSWLATELWCIGATTKLTINMTRCNDVFLTITAVAAALPSVSPSTLSYCVVGCCGNVCTQINWNNATSIVGIKDVTNKGIQVPLFNGVDYAVHGNTLVINGCISASAPAGWGGLACELDAGSRLARQLAINFNDSCNTTTILTINSACYTLPTITPTELVVDLDAWKCDPMMLTTSLSGVVVALGTAEGIANVTDITLNECCGTLIYNATAGLLVPITQWNLVFAPAYGGNLLVLSRPYYLGYAGTAMPAANFTKCGQTRTLLIRWLPTNEIPPCCATCSAYPYMYLPTKLTIKTTALGATICPVKADFNLDEANAPVDLDDPADVLTEITWGNSATNITKILESKCSIPELVRNVDYFLVPDGGNCTTTAVLNITSTYLKKVLKQVGDQAVLTIYFDTCASATFTITAVGTPLCFIATAAGANAPQLDVLRAFRDEVLRPNAPWLVDLYYEVSPPIAKVIAGNEALKTLVKEVLVDPATCIAEWLMGCC